MDSRILKKIKDLQKEQELNEDKEKKITKESDKYINKHLPEARRYVEEVLLDDIACAIVEAGYNELYIGSEWTNPLNIDIPFESIAKAVKEIEGLDIRKERIEKSIQWGSDECSYTEPTHYDYYVIWNYKFKQRKNSK